MYLDRLHLMLLGYRPKYLNLKYPEILREMQHLIGQGNADENRASSLRLQASHADLSYRLTPVLVYWRGRSRQALGFAK
jgi:hypothetical protein